MKRIYLILLAVLGMGMTSCLMEEKDLFDKSPAEIMDAYLSEYKDILASSENGWLLEYYPDEDKIYGGFAYIMKFTQSEVTVYFELDDDVSTPVTSLYKVTPDDGPVITFDTYNENLHYFATPDIVNYQAMHGDYEFRIYGKSDDGTKVFMKGKRTGNDYTLVKFSGDPVEYLDNANAVRSSISGPAYEITMNETVYPCSIKGNIFTCQYPAGEGEEAATESISVPFCYTSTGISFIEPVEINGVSYEGMTYNAEQVRLSTSDGKISIGIAPLKVEDLVGEFTFTATSAISNSAVKGTLVLELSDDPAKGNLMFTTMFDTPCAANVYADFDTKLGTLTIASPQLYYASASYLYGFVHLTSNGSPLQTPVVFDAGFGEFGGFNGFIGDCAFNPQNGAYLGYFEVYYNFTAKRNN